MINGEHGLRVAAVKRHFKQKRERAAVNARPIGVFERHPLHIGFL